MDLHHEHLQRKCHWIFEQHVLTHLPANPQVAPPLFNMDDKPWHVTISPNGNNKPTTTTKQQNQPRINSRIPSPGPSRPPYRSALPLAPQRLLHLQPVPLRPLQRQLLRTLRGLGVQRLAQRGAQGLALRDLAALLGLHLGGGWGGAAWGEPWLWSRLTVGIKQPEFTR